MIAIGCDHAGYDMKTGIIKFLEDKGIEVIDCGCDGSPCDYPVIAKKVCENITCGKADKGILICGTGIGMSIAANKVKGIRCAKVTNVHDTILTREHNNANVIALSANESLFKTKKIVNAFINTNFSNDERHVRRIEMMEKNDN